MLALVRQRQSQIVHRQSCVDAEDAQRLLAYRGEREMAAKAHEIVEGEAR